jgi:hypothetical protein
VEPLLELVYGTARDGGPNGLRVLDDGRFELRSDVDVDVDAEGRAQLRQVEPEWRLQWTYGPEELADLRREIAAATDPPLRRRYEPEGRMIHPGTHVWRLRTDGEVVETVVEGFPATRVPALDRLYRRLFELHRPERETSLWRVATPDGVVERLVDGDPEDVPALRPVLDAIYLRESREDEPSRTTDGPLVEIEWRSGDEPVETTRVFGDGRQEVVSGSATERLEPLGAGQLAALEAALDAVDWASLPPVVRPG